jgi:hypothetical protein
VRTAATILALLLAGCETCKPHPALCETGVFIVGGTFVLIAGSHVAPQPKPLQAKP